VAEDVLKEELTYARADGNKISVYVVRPVAITGPRGRKMRIRFGLQAALSGELKNESFFERLISLLVTWVPATKKWARQYVHEDDVADIVTLLALDSGETDTFETFNLCPPGPYVSAKDMAKAVNKKVLPVPPFLVRFAFFLFWNVSFGRIPTSPGGWKSYSYPILVDGTKITRGYGYKYKYQSLEAFSNLKGRFETFIKTLVVPSKR
jgi:nucleoside-diphosphate-sugar epimerase